MCLGCLWPLTFSFYEEQWFFRALCFHAFFSGENRFPFSSSSAEKVLFVCVFMEFLCKEKYFLFFSFLKFLAEKTNAIFLVSCAAVSLLTERCLRTFLRKYVCYLCLLLPFSGRNYVFCLSSDAVSFSRRKRTGLV